VEQIFSDGIGTIAIVGSTVRLDFVVVSPTEKDASGQPKLVHQHRLVMTLEGFANSAEKVRSAYEALQSIRSRMAGEQVAGSAPKPEGTASAPPAKRPFP